MDPKQLLFADQQWWIFQRSSRMLVQQEKGDAAVGVTET
jgi:hypothetical protein